MRSLSITDHWNVSLPSGGSPWNSIFGPGRGSKHNTIQRGKKWSKYFKHMVSPKKLLLKQWYSTKPQKQCLYPPNGDFNFFDIVTGVLQEDALTLYLFIIRLDYVLQTSLDLMKRNDLSLKKT